LSHSDNLSRTLQQPNISAISAQKLANCTVETLKKIRSDEDAQRFWEKTQLESKCHPLEPPKLPRKKKMPAKYEEGKSEPEFHDNCEKYFRQIYFESLDTIIACINDRFDQHDYKTLVNLEQILLKSVRNEDITDEMQHLKEFYGPDFNYEYLKLQLGILAEAKEWDLKALCFNDIVSYLKSISETERSLFEQVVKLVVIILVVPATNSTSERVFSTMRYIKNYLRSSMSQGRTNHLMLIKLYKDKVKTFKYEDIAKEFISRCERRQFVFGKFT
jgi:hypothetical protein